MITDGTSEITADGHVLARLSAQGQRRGDQRARRGSRAGRSPICGTPSSSTTTRSRALVSGEYPPLRQVRDALRLRPPAIDDGDRVRRDRSRRRRRRCASRAPASGSTRSTSARAPATVTGAAWVGWDGNYSFNADGTQNPGRVADRRRRSRARRSRACCSSPPPGTGTFDEPALRRPGARRRPVRRRRRHRPAHRAAVAARRAADRRASTPRRRASRCPDRAASR